MRTTLITGVLCATFASITQASPSIKDFDKLNASEAPNAYVSTGKLNHRVGNSVWATVLFDIHPTFKRASSVIIGCNGSWISSSFKTSVSLTGDVVDAYRSLEDRSMSQPDEYAYLDGGGLYSAGIEQALRKRAKTLCANARKEEPKGKLLGISENAVGENSGVLTSLVLGSTKIETNGLVKVWLRASSYTRVSVKDESGSQLIIDNEPVTRKVFEEQPYELLNWAYNCKDGTYNILQVVKYKPGKQVESSNQFDQKAFSEVVPGSTGEYELSWACKLYGKG